MRIGIDASRAFGSQKTGIEEYAYQVIKGLVEKLEQEIVLYVRPGDRARMNFPIPGNVRVKELSLMRGWTQVALSFQLLIDRIEVLFVPAHTMPLIHPKKSIVTVHGLEYEHCPESYSLYSRLFHRFFIRRSCRWSTKVVAVSRKTQKDLIDLYKTPKDKIEVIYNGFVTAGEESEKSFFKKKRIGQEQVDKSEVNWADFRVATDHSRLEGKYFSGPTHREFSEKEEPFILFIGRLEERKNIIGIVQAFNILKKDYNYPGRLLLAGKTGTGYGRIKKVIEESPFRHQIIELGFVRTDQKWQLLEKTDCFLFPSLCEGFGIPILEAQSVSTPVVTSNYGPMDEIAGNKNILADPLKPKKIAELINKLTVDKKFRKGVIKSGLENVKRFSWDRCVDELVEVFKKIG